MKVRGLIELLFLAAIWVGSFLCLRVASPAVGPLAVAAFRITGASLMLLPWVLLKRGGPALRRHAPPLCAGVAYLIFYRLIDRIGASRALTVPFLIPVFGMLWGALFLDKHITVLVLS